MLDATTGDRVWHADVDPSPYARSTGSPIVSGDLIFVPVSSAEVVVAANPTHECCSFRGNVAAFDLNTGEKRWHTYIMEEAKEVGLNSAGKRIFAPSGAPIWDAPTVDVKRRRVYVGSGQNYSRPASNSSDSVIASIWTAVTLIGLCKLPATMHSQWRVLPLKITPIAPIQALTSTSVRRFLA